MTFEQNLILVIIPVLLTALLAIIGWLINKYWKQIILYIRKSCLKLFPPSFNFALSIKSSDGLNTGVYFSEIKNNLLSEITQNHLNQLIKIKDISDIREFNSESEAEKFVSEKNLNLLVWGSLTSDNLKDDGKGMSEVKLKFTFAHPKDKNNKLGKMMLLDIDSRFATKNYWKIYNDNSYNDVNLVSKNLSDISLYTIALSLKVYGKISASLKLFESLHNSTTKKSDAFFNSQLIPHLINIYEIFILNAVYNKDKFREGKLFCEKLLVFRLNDFFGLSNLAFFQYKLGEIDKSKETVEKLLKIYPTRPLTMADAAFFSILQKDYYKVYKYYNKLTLNRPEQLDFNVLNIIDFLSEQYTQTKDPAILYGSGMISFYFGDKKIAKKDLRFFLKNANKDTCKKMYEKAEKVLNSSFA